MSLLMKNVNGFIVQVEDSDFESEDEQQVVPQIVPENEQEDEPQQVPEDDPEKRTTSPTCKSLISCLIAITS